MKSPAANWHLILRWNGKISRSFPLREGVMKIGREVTADIPLPSASISKCHAEIICRIDEVTLRDLASRNGVQVNGVARKKASLQLGDKIRLCEFELELTLKPPVDTPSLPLPGSFESMLQKDPTVEEMSRLPAEPHERHLATLYQLCFWVAEGLSEKRFTARALPLLREAFNATEAHLYSEDLSLRSHASDEPGDPRIQLASFLGKIFQEATEARTVQGVEFAGRQKGFSDFNYLVSPLAESPDSPPPFLVLLRPSERPDFSREERILLQAVCQLWVRSRGRAKEIGQLREENSQLKGKVGAGMVLGPSPVMARLLEQTRRVAATQATVLIIGETGSGKELIAQQLHDLSTRRQGPLIKMNCAAIPDSLMESELFGYEKGAFSGAIRDHAGKFAQADGGTLLLDEIGDMPLQIQAKVLRAIENREIQPLGSRKTLKPDIRIIAATHKDLAERVEQGAFRADLYYRLDVQRLTLPPLRERLEDLEALAAHFLERFCRENGLHQLSFDTEALSRLKAHDWPGNIRELWNVVQRCALATVDRTVTAEQVASHIRKR